MHTSNLFLLAGGLLLFVRLIAGRPHRPCRCGHGAARAMKRVLVLGLLWMAGTSHALVGEVIRVSDGDTLWVRPADARPVKVRLQGIDAPEHCQAGGPEAREALAARVLHRQVEIDIRARDVYGRAVAVLWLEGEDISGWMVRQGHAWSYRRQYATEQAQARRLGRGLFAEANPDEPRSFRKAHGPCDTAWTRRR
jgi:endonuclease YncB( thermonuclease family)